MTHAATTDHANPDDLATTLMLLEELVSFDTVSSKSNLPLVDRVEAYLKTLGVDFTRVPNADGDKAAIFATIGPRIDGGIVLSGHTDVVPVAGQAWTSDPFELRADGGRIYGRGTCDMKGFDAICLAMLPHFQRAPLTRPIHLLLSYDEEIGCQGPLDTIARFGRDLPNPAIAIIGEPTDMGVIEAHKGICSYETTVHGKEAHSSNPEAGVSAIEIACQLVGELSRFQQQLVADGDPSGLFSPSYSTVHVGRIEGGTARNILAKRCVFGWEFRPLPGVDPTLASKYLDAHIDRMVRPKLKQRSPEADVETLAHVEVPGLMADPGSPAETLAKRLTGSNRTGTVAFATEAGQFQRAGLSAIVCGPGSIRQAHQADEYIEVSQIDAGLAFMHRLIAELT